MNTRKCILALIVVSVPPIFIVHSVEKNKEVQASYKRLQEHVTQLRSWARQYRAVTTPPEQYKKNKLLRSNADLDFLDNPLVTFEHPKVCACVDAIKIEERLDVFFEMWDRFEQKTGGTVFSDDDELFIKDCSSLMLLFYNNILDECNQTKMYRVTVDEIMELYDAVSKLPISQLLDLLDSILEQLVTIMGNYALKPGQTVFGWLKKNWWVPPVMIGALVANILGL